MKTTKTILFAMLIGIITVSCRKEPATPINEEELITTMILTAQKLGTTTVQNFVFNDPDGGGGIAPTIDSLILDKAAQYDFTITLLNIQATPADTISNAVLEEGDVHQFFYQSIADTVLSGFTYQDTDINGKPIGLAFRLNTSNLGGSGKLKIILRHQPNKSGVNVSNGDITNADGETDVEVDFPVRLQ